MISLQLIKNIYCVANEASEKIPSKSM